VALIYRLYFLADETVGGWSAGRSFTILSSCSRQPTRMSAFTRRAIALAGEPWITGPYGSSWAIALDLASESAALCRRSSIVSAGTQHVPARRR